MWVFDATPLIYLATVDRLALVTELDGACVVPERVYEEVVETGVEQGYPDARRIERTIEEERLDVVSVAPSSLSSRLEQNSNLSGADVAVLAHAAANDAVAVMDETYGRDVAGVEGITTRGTAYVVLKCCRDGTIEVDDARTVLDGMIDAGWYCAPDVYAKLRRKLESFED